MREGVETGKVGKRGTVVIPARMRKRLGIKEGDLVIMEERREGLLLRRAVALPAEIYAPERKAEFLLMNAMDREGYKREREEVRKLGLDPDRIKHTKTPGVK